ncbi:MAG: H(+)/Cl(-) exchange transporter ClcA [Candidatus Heimdallarchaeota archaeon LC_2]|nr:MAG: H(+)/Cl(-) exchange transporter ClcA [Candidatus Heimdallarchaeota archaeon LC_2]OLS21164.1 MAG: H(+)/Cl(-) exchange transporter ClcA [Candidatus Heimdallarchaeota archaeon LC_2]
MDNLISRILTAGRQSEEETFENHIRQWFPIALAIGIVVGAVMSIFHMIIILFSRILLEINPLVIMTIAAFVILLLNRIEFEDPKQNGISYVLTKKHSEETIPIEVGGKKFVSSSLVLGSGMPVGREGPALIIGSSIASKIVELAKVPEAYRHQAITLGSAASTGALFQAPFGSAVFSAEVPYKEDSDHSMLMAAFLSSVVAAVTAATIVKFVNGLNFLDFSFHFISRSNAFLQPNFQNAFFALLLGVITGLIGRLFIEIYYIYIDKMSERFSVQKQMIYGYIFFFMSIALGGLFISDFYVLRGITPFEEIDNLIDSSQTNQTLIIMIFIQILATTALLGAGYPGGIFAPSLFIGALTGLFFSTILQFNDPNEIAAWAIIGMSGAHAATTKTPVASVLLILEITGLPNLIIPILLVNISSYIFSGHRSLYKGQIRGRDAIILRHLKEYDQHEGYTVGDVMTRLEDTMYLTKETTLTESMKIFDESSKRDFPVIQSTDDLTVIGMVFEEELLIIKEEGLDYIVEDFMETKIPNISMSLTGRDALTLLLDADIERAPVVDSNKKLIGIVSIGDIVRGHQTLIEIQKITKQ